MIRLVKRSSSEEFDSPSYNMTNALSSTNPEKLGIDLVPKQILRKWAEKNEELKVISFKRLSTSPIVKPEDSRENDDWPSFEWNDDGEIVQVNKDKSIYVDERYNHLKSKGRNQTLIGDDEDRSNLFSSFYEMDNKKSKQISMERNMKVNNLLIRSISPLSADGTAPSPSPLPRSRMNSSDDSLATGLRFLSRHMPAKESPKSCSPHSRGRFESSSPNSILSHGSNNHRSRNNSDDSLIVHLNSLSPRHVPVSTTPSLEECCLSIRAPSPSNFNRSPSPSIMLFKNSASLPRVKASRSPLPMPIIPGSPVFTYSHLGSLHLENISYTPADFETVSDDYDEFVDLNKFNNNFSTSPLGSMVARDFE